MQPHPPMYAVAPTNIAQPTFTNSGQYRCVFSPREILDITDHSTAAWACSPLPADDCLLGWVCGSLHTSLEYIYIRRSGCGEKKLVGRLQLNTHKHTAQTHTWAHILTYTCVHTLTYVRTRTHTFCALCSMQICFTVWFQHIAIDMLDSVIRCTT